MALSFVFAKSQLFVFIYSTYISRDPDILYTIITIFILITVISKAITAMIIVIFMKTIIITLRMIMIIGNSGSGSNSMINIIINITIIITIAVTDIIIIIFKISNCNLVILQVEKIFTISQYITNLERVGPGLGEYMFDKLPQN